MPHELQLTNLPGGIAAEAAKGGETAMIQVAGVATSEDGEVLIRYLGFAGELIDQLRKIGHDHRCSQIDNFLAIIRRDRSATVYVNELHLVSKIRIARACEAGEAIYKDDIIDITETRLGELDVPDDVGVICVLSQGWRKAVLFDFAAFAGDSAGRYFDIWPTLGQLVARLTFQERFSLSEADWKQMFACRWFPFGGLRNSTIESLIGHVRAGWGATELLGEMREQMLGKVDSFLESWRKKQQFSNHIQFFETAVERFKADDYLSCISIVFPRIEGVLRSHHIVVSPASKRSQAALSAEAVASISDNPHSLLLPLKFEQYLREVFFASFDDRDSYIPVNRNSAGHGVANADDYTLETAILGLLILHQLFYCFPPDSPSSDQPPNE